MIRLKLFVVMILCISAIIPITSGIVISPVCTDPGDQSYPVISGDTIVWEYNQDIYMWDPVNGTQEVCTYLNEQGNPAISGDTIVWWDDSNGYGDIYTYDLESGVIQAVCTDSGSQANPAISDGIIVWEDYRNGNVDIYMYDLESREESSVCTILSSQEHPAVSNGIIVWQDSRNYDDTGYDIYMYDLVSKQEKPVCIEPGHQETPDISGDTVVWVDFRNGNYDIYMWNPVNLEQPVCTDENDQDNPVISGNTIVWEENGDIYMRDMASEDGKQPVCTDPSFQGFPDISGDTVVWVDTRGAESTDIYMADLSVAPVAPVSDAGPDQVVQIGETVTFNGSDSSDLDGSVVSYTWEFGDGSTSTDMIATHMYTLSGTYTATLTVIDTDDLTDTDTASITVQTPQEGLDDLIIEVSSLELPPGIENGLTAKLYAAIKSCNKGNDGAAVNQIHAFINQVHAKVGKSLTEEEADFLISEAQDIITAIGV